MDVIAHPFVRDEVVERVQTHLAIRRDLRQGDKEFPATMRDIGEAPDADDDLIFRNQSFARATSWPPAFGSSDTSREAGWANCMRRRIWNCMNTSR